MFWERGNSAAELMQGQNFKKEIHKHDIHKKKNSKAGIFTLLPRSVVALMRHNRPPEQVDVDAVAQPLSHPPSSSSPMHLDPERAAAYATAAEAAAAPASAAANDDDDDDDAADSPPPRPELGEGVTDALRTASSIRLQARLLDSVTRLRAQTVSYTLRRGVARWRTGNLEECVDDTRAAAEGMIALGLANPIRDRNRNRNEHEHEHESGDDNGGCSLRPRGWIPDDSRGSDGGGGIREEDDDDDNDDGDRGSDCGSAARTMVGGPESVETINYYLGVSLAALGDVRGGVRALEEAAAAGAWRSRWRGRHRRERKEKAKEMEMEVEEEDWARSGEGVHPATMFELAKLRMRAGDASGAETAAAATLSGNPNNREACLCHAHALHALKRYDEAAEELMRECQLRRLESDNKCGSAARNTSSSPSSPMVLPELLELSTLTWLPSSKNDGDVPSSSSYSSPPPQYLLPVDPTSDPKGLGYAVDYDGGVAGAAGGGEEEEEGDDAVVVRCDGPTDVPAWTYRGGSHFWPTTVSHHHLSPHHATTMTTTTLSRASASASASSEAEPKAAVDATASTNNGNGNGKTTTTTRSLLTWKDQVEAEAEANMKMMMKKKNANLKTNLDLDLDVDLDLYDEVEEEEEEEDDDDNEDDALVSLRTAVEEWSAAKRVAAARARNKM